MSTDVGVFQLENGYWGYRFVITKDKKARNYKRVKDESGKPFKTKKQALTRLAEMNTPMHILCNQMGHASSKVTEHYYLAVSKSGVDILLKNLNTF